MSIQVDQYKLGDGLVTTGEKITHIAGQSKLSGVYIVTGDRIRWEWYDSGNVPKHVYLAVSKLEDIYFRIGATIAEKRRSPLIKQVANALFSAIDACDNNVEPYFSAITEQLAFRSNANQSFKYMMGCIVGVLGAVVVSLALMKVTGIPNSILIGVSGGAFGALLSVLMRIRSLNLSKYAPLWYTFFQGVARTGLGVLFGIFFVLANKGDIAMSAYKDNMWAISAFSIVAGLSERFVPELIRRMEVHGKPDSDNG